MERKLVKKVYILISLIAFSSLSSKILMLPVEDILATIAKSTANWHMYLVKNTRDPNNFSGFYSNVTNIHDAIKDFGQNLTKGTTWVKGNYKIMNLPSGTEVYFIRLVPHKKHGGFGSIISSRTYFPLYTFQDVYLTPNMYVNVKTKNFSPMQITQLHESNGIIFNINKDLQILFNDQTFIDALNNLTQGKIF